MTTSKHEVVSNPESEDDDLINFKSTQYQGKRYAKADELNQKDILHLFTKKMS